MNSPNPVPASQVSVPASTPTAGAIVGGLIAQSASAAIAAATGGILPPIITVPAITAICTWLAHFAHSKLGTPE